MKSDKEIQQINRFGSLNYSRDDVQSLEKKAKNVIKSLTSSFEKEAKDFLDEMDLLLQEASLLEKNERTYLFKNRFFRLAHDLKGQGATYGFEMITVLSDHICDVVRHKKYFSQKEIEDFLLDVTDMKKVLLCPPFETSHSLKKQIANRLEKYKCLK